MIRIDKKTKGYLLLIGGLFLIWLGSYFRAPLIAQHKILVASSSEDGGPFEDAVILVMQHNPTGAYGFVLNRGDFGGPVDTDQIYALHLPDVMLENSVMIEDLGIAIDGDTKEPEGLEKSKWSIVVKGYAGWGIRQLDREIRRGVWKVIDYDKTLVTETPQDKMFEEAEKRPEAVLEGVISP